MIWSCPGLACESSTDPAWRAGTPPGADLGLADSAFWEAAAAFQEVLQDAPGDLRATGNLGEAIRVGWRGRISGTECCGLFVVCL